MSTPETTVVTIIVEDDTPDPPPAGRVRTVVTPNPLRLRPGGQAVLSVAIESDAGRRPITGFAAAPFSSGGTPGPSGLPVAVFQRGPDHWDLEAHQLRVIVPVDYPPGQVLLTVGGL
ncbi:MAG: hypothetical protein AB7G23_19180 [Vicinamibacterales bacterium]